MAKPLGSKYILQEALGRGAMGQVFAGYTRPAGEPVAIKVLRPELVSDPEVVTRFVQERTILMSIADPNVVRVFDLVVEGDTLGIVMELVQGSDLRRQLRARGTVPPAEAVHYTGQLLRGAAAVHAAGIVHRDIKPENVLFDTSSGRPRLKLTDFGVARLSYGASLTKLSGLIGTPEYMAPELAEHNRATPAADVYSAGVVLYEMLCGRTPFAGGHPVAVLRRQADQAPPVIPGVPPELWDRIAWMLAKDPASRPSSAAEACAVLAPLEFSLASRPALAPWAGPESWAPAHTAATPGQAGPQAHAGPAPGGTVLRHRDRGELAASGGPGAQEGLPAGLVAQLTAPSQRKRQARVAVLAIAVIAVLGLVTTVAMAATHRPAALGPKAGQRATAAMKGTMSPAAAAASARPTGTRTAAPGSAASGGGLSGSTVSGGGSSGATGSGGGLSGSSGSGGGLSGSSGSGGGTSGSTRSGGGSTGSAGTGKTASGGSQSSGTGAPALSAAEQQLAGKLNPAMFYDCTGRPDLESGDTVTAINCSYAGTGLALRPLAETFPSGDASAWLQSHTTGFKNSGSCADGSYVGTWSRSGSVAGQIGCGIVGGNLLRIVWVVGNQVGMIAEGSDHQAMYTWWKSMSCPVTAAC